MTTHDDTAAALARARTDGFREGIELAQRVCRDEIKPASPAGNAALTLVVVRLSAAKPRDREPGDVLVLRESRPPAPAIEVVDADETAARAFAMRGVCDEPGVGIEQRTTVQGEARRAPAGRVGT